ncbi:MAG: hypothetical protein M3317_04920 [Actinomycetota bacterium]|nr:hypothetical protein [Actinomycetota bacterium]
MSAGGGRLTTGVAGLLCSFHLPLDGTNLPKRCRVANHEVKLTATAHRDPLRRGKGHGVPGDGPDLAAVYRPRYLRPGCGIGGPAV